MRPPGLPVRGLASCLAALVLPLLGAPAWAEEQDPESDHWDGGYDVKYEKRSGFTIGTSTGLVLGSASGFPNDVNTWDKAAFETDTGVGVGYGSTFWLGGALTDWFVFGVGGAIQNFSGDADAKSFAVLFRVEGFPFWTVGEFGKDLGLNAHFGIGGMTVDDGSTRQADGGAMSVIGLGGFYELWHFGGFALGPSVEYGTMFARPLNAHFATLGLHAAFYTGP